MESFCNSSANLGYIVQAPTNNAGDLAPASGTVPYNVETRIAKLIMPSSIPNYNGGWWLFSAIIIINLFGRYPLEFHVTVNEKKNIF